MKTVIVFDTSDPKGMKNAYRTIMFLAREYMKLDAVRRVELTKIQLINALREFSRENLSGEQPKSKKAAPIKECMEFADHILKKYGVATIPDEDKE